MRHVRLKAIYEAAPLRKPGYVEEVLRRAVKKTESYVTLEDKDFNQIRSRFAIGGPGTHLHSILSSLGMTFSAGCKCKNNAKQMDEWGCDECEKRIDEIEGWLKAEAHRRRLPYLSTVGRMLVRRAIHNARKEAERAKDTT
jgi:hypothetical protein